jgi:colicin import membrane protein
MQSMNLTKLSAAIILALSTAACSSGGSHSTTSTSPVITEQTAAEKAEADRLAAEKAEADRLAAEKAEADRLAAEKAEADRLAAEKAEADRLAAEKAEADRLAAEKAEADRLAAEKAEADRLAAEKAEADRLAAEKAEADRLAAEKAEADRLAAEKAEADRLAAEKAEADRLAAEKAEADRLAAEKAEADRLAAEKAAAEKAAAIEANRLVLLNKAKEAGLNDQQAAAYAEDNKEADEMSAQTALESILVESERIALDEALYQAKDKYHNNNAYPIGQITAKKLSHSDVTTNGDRTIRIKHEVVYNQPYSVVIGDYSSWTTGVGSYIFNSGMDSSITIKGLKTEVSAIPFLGTANYSGKAFSSEKNPIFASTSGLYQEGLLSYDVNFTDKTGVGSITGLGDVISLNQGSISGTGITSTAKQLTNTGTYSLDFYGKKAEEIAGKVIFNGKDTVGFGGTRGEITK